MGSVRKVDTAYLLKIRTMVVWDDGRLPFLHRRDDQLLPFLPLHEVHPDDILYYGTDSESGQMIVGTSSNHYALMPGHECYNTLRARIYELEEQETVENYRMYMP